MNVNLWFARDDNGEIISVVDSNESNTYVCPICNSDVIPKALTSVKVSPHFAHIDKTKCDSESMLHFWFKHKFIERGDTFTIKADKEYNFVCEDYSVEKQFNLESGNYRPDLLVTTECGNEIVFEMANTNKKKVQDYIDRWIELDKIIVEVDIKSLQGSDKVFNALYYNGKCFNFNKRDGGYYNTVGKLKEEMVRNNKYSIEKIKELDWFWRELKSNSESRDVVDYLSILIEEEIYNETLLSIMKKHKKMKLIESALLNIKLRKTISLQNQIDEYNPLYEIRVDIHTYSDGISNTQNYFIKRKDKKYGTFITQYDKNVESVIDNLESKYYSEWNTEKLQYYTRKVTNKYNSNEMYSFCKREKDNELNQIHLSTRVISIDKSNYLLEFNKLNKLEINDKLSYYLNKESEWLNKNIKSLMILEQLNIHFDERNLTSIINFDIQDDTPRLKINWSKISDRGDEIIDNPLAYLTSLHAEKECIMCKGKINIDKNELLFFLNKDLEIPKRCKTCRQKRKNKERCN